MFWFLFIMVMGVLGRMSGNGFGQKWGIAWLPEWLYAIPFGLAASYAYFHLIGSDLNQLVAIAIGAVGVLISYAGMQSATWYFLRWEKHSNPNLTRGGTVKPVVDFIAKLFGWKIGDEGYAWVGAAVKGFIIGLPVGSIITTILWPLGYEIGSHAKGRVERFGIKDSHAVSEFLSAAGGGVAIMVFIEIIKGI